MQIFSKIYKNVKNTTKVNVDNNKIKYNNTNIIKLMYYYAINNKINNS